MTRLCIWSSAILLLPLIMVGCRNQNLPQTIPFSGKVYYNGKPLEYGEMTFEVVNPAPGFPSRPAIASIQPDGQYKLSTFVADDGIVPGEYRVRILCFKGNPSFDVPASQLVWAIPQKYGSSETSGLEVIVSPEQRGPIVKDLHLTD